MVKKFLLELLESIILSIILIALVAGGLWIAFSVAIFIMDVLPTLNFLEHFDR
jgi:hypothetical protein